MALSNEASIGLPFFKEISSVLPHTKNVKVYYASYYVLTFFKYQANQAQRRAAMDR